MSQQDNSKIMIKIVSSMPEFDGKIVPLSCITYRDHVLVLDEKAFKEYQESLDKKHAEQMMEEFHAKMILENSRKPFDVMMDVLDFKRKSPLYKSPKDHWWRDSHKKKFKKR